MATFYRIVKIQQQGETSLTATIPNDMAEKLDISKGQYMKIYIANGKVVLEKNE